MRAVARALSVISIGLFITGGLLLVYGVISADSPTFNPHRTAQADAHANSAPYYMGYRIFSLELGTGYASLHSQAVDKWNQAIVQNQYLQVYSSVFFPPTHFIARIDSPEDDYIHALFNSSCGDELLDFPQLINYRAFEFGLMRDVSFGDNDFTMTCLNHSAYTNCVRVPPNTTCFDATDVTDSTRLRGLVHEFGHALHLGHPGFAKGAMWVGWGLDINSTEANYVHFAYSGEYGHVRQIVLAGLFNGLHECLIDESEEVGPTITMSVYCYVNVPGIDVNPEAYPGVSGNGQPGGLPADVYGDVNDIHAELSGHADLLTNIVHMSGCIEDRDGQAELGHVYVEWTWDKITGLGSADTWIDETQSNCLAGTPFGAADSTGSLELLDVIGQENPDYDGDGVPTDREFGTDAACGQRDPFNPYDYYDVSIPKDGVIDLPNDISGVINHFAPGGYPPGWENWDRPRIMAGAPLGSTWNRGAPDGVIDLPNDISGVIQQFNPGGCPPLS